MSSVEPAVMHNNPSFSVDAMICSILPREDGQPFTIANRTHGVYRVFHPQVGEAYKLTPVGWKKDYADVGDYDPAYQRRTGVEKRKEFTFDAKQIAEDICKEMNSNGPGEGSFFGVFVCSGQEPTKQELDKAKQRLEGYFMQTIAAADAQWSANPRHDLISGIAKRGARYLGLEREWLSTYRQLMECPACGERIRPGVAICKGCGAILDKKKAEEFGLIGQDSELKEQKPVRSKPRQGENI